ncbi:hypothetical protein [Bdellovibrio sp. HCB-110]|uniref:hypothetical protein n=1 Tax=Bdellovibrio sp. HCB-110 TaxID=3391182 RepID=UPI0039B42BAB
MKHFDDKWFYDHLKNQTILTRANQVFSSIHGPNKRPEIAIEVLQKNLDPLHVEKCVENLNNLDGAVPHEFAQVIRACAVTYANFCDEIFAGLDDFYYQSIRLEWLLHSESSYSPKGRYRDHITHQMKVTLLGLEFLDGNLTESPLLEDTIKALKESKALDKFLRFYEIEENLIDREVVTAAWLLAGLFHDIGYCFLMHVKTSRNLSKVSPLFNKNPQHLIWDEVKDLIQDSSLITSFFKEFGLTLTSSSSLEEVKSVIYSSAFEGKNHSVIGGLYLLYMLSTLESRASKVFKSELVFSKKIKLVFELAALAVLTHDIDSPSKQMAFQGPDEKKAFLFKDSFKISFSEYPLSFLLGVCDQLQEWGRIRVKREVADSPNLIYERQIIDCNSVEIRIINKRMEVYLNLDASVDKKFMPSFPLLGKGESINGITLKESDVTKILSTYREGRFGILNLVYGPCPSWQKYSIFVRAGGAIFTFADFFADQQTRTAIQSNFY